MDGCMDAWMDGWMDAWMDGWMDGCMHGCMDGWMDGCMHACMHGCMDGWMDACMHARTVKPLISILTIAQNRPLSSTSLYFSRNSGILERNKATYSLSDNKELLNLQ